MSAELFAAYTITGVHTQTRKIACPRCTQFWIVPKCWLEKPPEVLQTLLRNHLLEELAKKNPQVGAVMGMMLHPPTMREDVEKK
jgi:hypothetical protein